MVLVHVCAWYLWTVVHYNVFIIIINSLVLIYYVIMYKLIQYINFKIILCTICYILFEKKNKIRINFYKVHLIIFKIIFINIVYNSNIRIHALFFLITRDSFIVYWYIEYFNFQLTSISYLNTTVKYCYKRMNQNRNCLSFLRGVLPSLFP